MINSSENEFGCESVTSSVVHDLLARSGLSISNVVVGKNSSRLMIPMLELFREGAIAISVQPGEEKEEKLPVPFLARKNFFGR